MTDTAKVKLGWPWTNPDTETDHEPGETIEVSVDQARQLVRAGAAQPVGDTNKASSSTKDAPKAG